MLSSQTVTLHKARVDGKNRKRAKPLESSFGGITNAIL